MQQNRKKAISFVFNRRQLILSAAGAYFLKGLSAPAFAQDETSVDAKVVKLFTKNGSGRNHGGDWQNAMPIGWLTKSLDLARPGSVFLIGADQSDKSAIPIDRGQISIKKSGTAGNPIVVSAIRKGSKYFPAIDMAETEPPLFKSSIPWSVERFSQKKNPPCYLALNGGASHLELTGFQVDGTTADGLLKFRGGKGGSVEFTDVKIAQISANNVGRVIETDKRASLSNIRIEDCQAQSIVRGFARFYDLSQGVFRNLNLDAKGVDGGGRNVCQIISIVKGDNILFENVTVSNAVNARFLDNGLQGYVQGDGIVCERGTKDVTIRGCHGNGMGDAAFDLKTTRVTIEDSSSESCKFGARIWSESENVIRRCNFRNPVSQGSTEGACVQASGTLTIQDTVLEARGDTTALALHRLPKGNAPTVHMYGGAITLHDNAKMARASAAGILELHDVSVNGTLRSQRYEMDSTDIL